MTHTPLFNSQREYCVVPLLNVIHLCEGSVGLDMMSDAAKLSIQPVF